MKNGGGGAPANNAPERLLKKNFGFTLKLFELKRRILPCHPEGGTRRRKNEMLKLVQHDKDSGVILNLFQDLSKKSKNCRVDLPKQKGILRQEWSLSLSCTNHAQNDKALKMGTSTCYPEGRARRICKNSIQGILHFAHNDKKCAFTMAEVLITLGIIGIIAAITLPSLIGNYQKKVTVERLKKVYTVLNQAVMFSIKDNEAIEYWDFDSLTAQEFMDRYLVPYFQNVASEEPLIQVDASYSYSNVYAFADGTTLYGWLWHNPQVNGLLQIVVDINGKAKPNIYGRDKFIFYIFSQRADWYNTGSGNVAKNIPGAGLYPDGYGYDRERMKNDSWRGCNRRGDEESLGNQAQAGAFCTAMIMLDGWKISDDYKW